MVYVGSKNRLAKHIVPILQHAIDVNQVTHFYDLFCGGCNIIDKIKCENKIANDKNRYLIALLKHAQEQDDLRWLEQLDDLTKESYKKVKNNKESYADWYVGAVGILASFRSIWLGGLAKSEKENRVSSQIANFRKQIPNLKDIQFVNHDYLDIDTKDINNAVVYLDPPYRGTMGYNDSFDDSKFWVWARELSEYNQVFVSEYQAPEDFECVIEMPLKMNIGATVHDRVEKLFKLNSKPASGFF